MKRKTKKQIIEKLPFILMLIMFLISSFLFMMTDDLLNKINGGVLMLCCWLAVLSISIGDKFINLNKQRRKK